VLAALNVGWRVFATGLLFAVFGVGGILQSVVVFPTISLVSRDEHARIRRTRACIGASFRGFLRLMELLGVCRFDIDARVGDHLDGSGGAIIVANHPTLFDVVVLLAHADQANCVVKSALWRNRILSHVVSAAGYIPNDGWERVSPACERALESGEDLIIFPEATRSVPGKPLRLQRGAAAIALTTRAPLKLVHLDCVPLTLYKGNAWYRVPPQQPCFTLRLGGTLDPGAYWQNGERLSAATRRLTQDLQSRFSEHLHEHVGTGAQGARGGGLEPRRRERFGD
jgi:1-acyl-sn-glycerol-3-phosphate acyltransferase